MNSRETKPAASATSVEARPAPSLAELLCQKIQNSGAASLEELFRAREGAFTAHHRRKAAPPRDWLKEVSAVLDSTDYRSLSKAERAVLAKFCAAHQVPVVPRKQTNTYVGREPELLSDDNCARTFLSGEKEMRFAKKKRCFQRFLFEAKDPMASAAAVPLGTDVCLEHQCHVSSRRPIQYQMPLRKRARKDEGEKAKRQRTTPAEEQPVPSPPCCPAGDASPQSESDDECHGEDKCLEEMAKDLEALLWNLPESY